MVSQEWSIKSNLLSPINRYELAHRPTNP